MAKLSSNRSLDDNSARNRSVFAGNNYPECF